MTLLPAIVLFALLVVDFLPAKTGFISQPVSAQETFTIGVKVTEGTGQGPGISGVTVVLVMNGSTQFTAQTDANGNCSFTGISGSYEVTPSKPNYVFNPFSQGGNNTGSRTLFFTGSSTSNSSVHFSSFGYSVSESAPSATLTVVRTGDTGTSATVSYATSDGAGLNNCDVFNGLGSSRCDYAASVGTVSFAAGETSRTISVPLVDDSYAEGSETFSVVLSNPVGAGISSPGAATVTINDNETTNGPNPIAQTAFFVRQHYIDFLGREPDPAGFQGWQNVINSCPSGQTTCDRIHVSGNFFQSAEFQQRGNFVYRFYPVSFGRKPHYAEFIPDLARVSGFLSDAQLEAAKVAFINDFVARPDFATAYNGLNNSQYVDTLLATAGITHASRDSWIAALANGTRTRAQVLREIAESSAVASKYYNQAFVVMQYFGYLRRDPDGSYVNWIQVLDSTGDSRGMINGFVNSLEYRFRFGP